MGYQSRLVDDYDYWRETRVWRREEDELDREQVEHDREEAERYTAPSSTPILLPRRPS